MHTIIHPKKANSRRPTAAAESFRNPHYECTQMADAVKLVVFVPGVDAAGVEIYRRGPDLTITARKAHFVRVNWRALHLEHAQLDYRLRLRLGNQLDYDTLHAEIIDGVLTILIPKQMAMAEPRQRVA